MNSRNQSYIVYFLLFVAIIVLVFYGFNNKSSNDTVLTINQLADEVKSGKISRITVENNNLNVFYTDGTTEKTSTKESETTLVAQLTALGVTQDELSSSKIGLSVIPPSPYAGLLNALFYIVPFLLFGVAMFFIFRQAQGSNNAAMSFGKSRRGCSLVIIRQ